MSAGLVRILAVALGLFAQSCTSPRATEAQCHAIFDRIVELELQEMGFRDPALAVRRKVELRTRYRGLIQQCVGRHLSLHALDCVAAAKTTEQLSHKCLH